MPGRTMTRLDFDDQYHKNQQFEETHARIEHKHTRSINNVHSAFVQKMLVDCFSKSDVWCDELKKLQSNQILLVQLILFRDGVVSCLPCALQSSSYARSRLLLFL